MDVCFIHCCIGCDINVTLRLSMATSSCKKSVVVDNNSCGNTFAIRGPAEGAQNIALVSLSNLETLAKARPALYLVFKCWCAG